MENFKTIISFPLPNDAHIAKGYLESNGIEVLLKDEMTVQVNNFYSNAVGGIKLLTKDSDYDGSIQLLKEAGYINGKETKTEFCIETVKLEATTDQTICPFCKSDNIRKNRTTSILVLPVYFILGFIFPIFRLSYKCFDCERNWKYRK